MPKICGQVSTPTVDETQLECEEITLSTCVEVKQICSKVGNLTGENLDKFIERLCLKLSKVDNQLYQMSAEIKVLKNKIKTLEDNV